MAHFYNFWLGLEYLRPISLVGESLEDLLITLHQKRFRYTPPILQSNGATT